MTKTMMILPLLFKKTKQIFLRVALLLPLLFCSVPSVFHGSVFPRVSYLIIASNSARACIPGPEAADQQFTQFTLKGNAV